MEGGRKKIVGFSQLHNEHEKGNLENWFRCMNAVCDKIYILDQASTDNSQEIYENEEKAVVVYGEINNFENEISCKKLLLERLLKNEPDADWIFWMDGDTLLERRLLDRTQLESLLDTDADSISLGHLNMWRSKTHFRTDNKYDWLHQHGVICFWKNKPGLHFKDQKGLHNEQFPKGITTCARVPYVLIHMGFSTDKQILSRYDMYKSYGQEGWALDRLIEEETLTLQKIDLDLLPEWITLPKEDLPTSSLINRYGLHK